MYYYVEMSSFLLVDPGTPLVDCGIACSKQLTDCNTFYISGLQCHLLKVEYIYEMYWYNKVQVDCKLIDYSEEDGILTFTKLFIKEGYILPEDRGKQQACK